MRHPAAVLTQIEKNPKENRIILLGNNDYVKGLFRATLSQRSTLFQEYEIDPSQLRSSSLRVRDFLWSTPLPWDKSILWVNEAGPMLEAMSFPDDFPANGHSIVLCASGEGVYCPTSFTPVQMEVKGNPLQELIRWILLSKGMGSEPDAVKFLASEYKEDLGPMDKLLAQLQIIIHPRTILSLKDLEIGSTSRWDSELIVRSMIQNDDVKALKEVMKALETFHPKGIITVLSRRISLMMQVARSTSKGSDQPEFTEIKPWIWRQNVELTKEILPVRMARWGLLLDRAYSTMSSSRLPQRWVLINTIIEMCKVA